MGYVPKFIHLDHFIVIEYPFGVHWKHSYIQQSAGAVLNELHNINPTTKTYILIVRKEEDTSAHCSSLRGIDEVGTTRFIVVDDFIASGETIEAVIQALDEQLGIFPHPTNKYDMLCISNFISVETLKKNSYSGYRKWKGICSRFEYVVCCPKPE